MDNHLLQGKYAVVTAGAHGLGRCISELFASHGATVALCGKRKTGEATAEAIRKTAPGSFFYQCDLSDAAQTAAFCKAVLARFGRVDVLINNVGITINQPVECIDEETLEYVLVVNLKSAFRMQSHLVKAMPSGSAIVNISSVHSVATFEGKSSYAASKGGLNAMTRAAAVELASKGIRVNAICPGCIITQNKQRMIREASADPSGEALDRLWFRWQDMQPCYGQGRAVDVAATCLFLASPLSGYITGAVIMQDGGASRMAHCVPDFYKPDDFESLVWAYRASHEEII